VRVNSLGQDTFENAVLSLERLGRSLQGYQTDTPPTAAGTPGTGIAYTAAQFEAQTTDIKTYMDQLDVARESEIQPERVNIAGRLKRLETAGSLLELTQVSTKEVLSQLQDADLTESATNLALAQTALEASLSVTNRVLNLSILDFL
jgi:flagellin-like hook-associated protein FlgL